MANTHGSLSINSDNIFPIIKKWLYSDHDIFYRELISNGCDAITKLKKLELMGEYSAPEDNKYQVKVIVSAKDKTIKFIDNGLGMTADEVNEYICQIAFSGAEAFLEKYKDKANEDQIIGHFGLGFYSAFMVADRVTIDTLSYQEGAKPVHWECDGGTEYDMEEGTKTTRGTEITLYLSEECNEFANEYRAKEVIEKYCSFMPVEIYVENADAGEQYQTINEDELLDTDKVVETIVEEAKTEEIEKEDGTKETVETVPASKKLKIVKRPVPINDTTPLWTKHPNDCTEEQYKEFYRKVFKDYKEPLFWIHLNMDYPFNLKGILYFPKLNTEYDTIEGTIKLYNNQVFVADNIKEIIPEFLLMLKGVIDCPDVPLNVSRSFLQNDRTVGKIADHIVKKIADKLTDMFKNDRENYEKYWEDISGFIKFGAMSDPKFYDKVKDCLIYKTTMGKYVTMTDYLAGDKKEVYYATSGEYQKSYINLFSDQGIEVLLMPGLIDATFVQFLESKFSDVKFMSIDSVTPDSFKSEETGADAEKTKKLFAEFLPKDTEIETQSLKSKEVPALVMIDEYARRMRMISAAMGGTDFPDKKRLMINLNNPLIESLADMDKEKAEMVINQIYDLARMESEPLGAEDLEKFIKRSVEMLGMIK